MHVNHSTVRSGLRTAAAPIRRRRLLRSFGRNLLLSVLNRTCTRQHSEGEFELLIGRVFMVSITDFEVRWSFTANATGDRIVKATGPADATIRRTGPPRCWSLPAAWIPIRCYFRAA